MKGIWFSELQNSGLAISCLTKRTLHSETTPFQELEVIDTETFGRMLVLDGAIQTTINDEFIYHEMITLVALNTHANPKKVLVIGGGDGGSIREIIKHPAVEKATLVEIDHAVVKYAKEFLPEISCALEDPRVEVLIDDGIAHVESVEAEYDIIIVDSTDPVGPAVGLFSPDFYRSIFKALKEDGILVAQTESPFFNQELISHVYRDISSIFPVTRLYLANIPTYPSGLWSFTMGSKKYDPIKADKSRFPQIETRYYTPELHFSAFVLPKFAENLLRQG
ncbi:MAG: polyamine aminopropyltransferase [Bacillota bacterium]